MTWVPWAWVAFSLEWDGDGERQRTGRTRGKEEGACSEDDHN